MVYLYIIIVPLLITKMEPEEETTNAYRKHFSSNSYTRWPRKWNYLATNTVDAKRRKRKRKFIGLGKRPESKAAGPVENMPPRLIVEACLLQFHTCFIIICSTTDRVKGTCCHVYCYCCRPPIKTSQ